MVSDILSQEEIDKLLSVSGLGDGTGSEAAVLDAEQLARLTRLVNYTFTAANSTLATLVACEVEASGGEGAVASPAEIGTGASVLVCAPFRYGLPGELFLSLPMASATIISDLALGGDGESKIALDEDDNSALIEAFGHLLDDATTIMAATDGVEVGFETVTVEALGPGALPDALGSGDIYACKGNLKIAGIIDTPLFAILTAPTAKSISAALAPPEPPATPKATFTLGDPPPPTNPTPEELRNIDFIMDIEVEVLIRLGDTEMLLKDIQKLRPGSIIDLDKDTAAPVELVVNDRVIAQGELVVEDSGNFALRVTEIKPAKERIRSLGAS